MLVCVEIDAGTELPYDVRIIVNGELVVVAIQYQWVPPICCDCKVFGHPQGSWSKQVSSKPPKDVWQVVGKGKIQANTGPEIQVVDESIPSSSFCQSVVEHIASTLGVSSTPKMTVTLESKPDVEVLDDDIVVEPIVKAEVNPGN
ncbi:hypothetical protein RHMOL_Rhmol04G0222600 [Rhododendron molle]|uniref:Uncharacterized protein n=1 Tax=Rhododendron molle TaxID=49168 RepID=A0ACC0P490_RHOML|nr:hypothetical protein RHMOL_Rhmol04G0222600 [Rhododendron molle]